MSEADGSPQDTGPAKSPGFKTDPPPPFLQNETAEDRRISYVIVIGIDEYQDTTLNLSNCKKDGEDLIEALKTNFKDLEIEKTLYNEAAKKDNIIKAIQDFCEDKTKNNVFNNLILYFSGHGGFVQTPARKIGSWIPHDYNDNNQKNSQLRLDDLMKELEFLETLHLMVIADCCYAGTLFQESNLFFLPSDAPIPQAEDLGFEPSRWGIASSRKSERSGAGNAGDNSIFTAALVQRLKANNKPKISFRELATPLLIDDFAANPNQRVEYKELKIAKINTGEFFLTAKEEPIASRKRYTALESGIRNLKYDDQRAQFLDFETCTQKIHFTFMSGTPTCGLYFLSSLARESNSIGAHLRLLINPQIIKETSNKRDERLLLLFKLMSKDANRVNSLDQIRTLLTSPLANRNVVIEIRFYQTVVPSMDITTHRKQVIEDLTDFAQTINQQIQGKFRLYIFIVDLENADYKTLVPTGTITGADALIVEKVSDLSQLKFKLWYDATQRTFPKNPAGLSEFKQLFDDLIYKQVPTIFEQKENQSPAHIIKQVCQLANCNALAEKLLNQ